ncbi:MAG: FAD binding domain-containing protein [Ardenticatenaceae bacterium]
MSRLIIASTLEEAIQAEGEMRAGGTDVQERRRSGVSSGPIVDISRLPGLDGIDWHPDGAVSIGTLVKIATVGADERIRQHYPGLAMPAESLATPQIRYMGTMGGVVLQHTRCWYYRHHAFNCYKKGGDSCPARNGNHQFGVCFDLGPCVYPHPSSIGMALIAYDADVEIHWVGHPPTSARRSVANLYGDGSDPTRHHQLKSDEIMSHIHLPPPVANEQAAYFRLMSRAAAEWPLVECIARLVIEDGTIRFARVAIGGVANIPLQLPHVEDALEGEPATQSTLQGAAQLATEGAKPLPQTAYKVPMIYGTVLETLQRALDKKGSGEG